jgi:hypothetical protein
MVSVASAAKTRSSLYSTSMLACRVATWADTGHNPAAVTHVRARWLNFRCCRVRGHSNNPMMLGEAGVDTGHIVSSVARREQPTGPTGGVTNSAHAPGWPYLVDLSTSPTRLAGANSLVSKQVRVAHPLSSQLPRHPSRTPRTATFLNDSLRLAIDPETLELTKDGIAAAPAAPRTGTKIQVPRGLALVTRRKHCER